MDKAVSSKAKKKTGLETHFLQIFNIISTVYIHLKSL